jgi:prepilin peptidase CpaA
MRAELLALAPIGLYSLVLVTAAVFDFFQRRIPNWAVVSLILLFIVYACLGLTLTTWTSSLAAFGVALAGSGALYLAGWLGAGDSKLFAAAALFAGLGNLLLLFVATVLAGGLYALVVLFIRPKEVLRGMTARGRAEGKLRGIPYGVAIAAGALVTAYLTQFHGAPHQL